MSIYRIGYTQHFTTAQREARLRQLEVEAVRIRQARREAKGEAA